MSPARPAQRVAIAIERRAIPIVVAVVVWRVTTTEQGGVEDCRVTIAATEKEFLRLFRNFGIGILPGVEFVQDVIADTEARLVDHRWRQCRCEA